MPFKSEKQRRFLWAKHPEIAKRWADEYPGQKNLPMYANQGEEKPAPDKEKAAFILPGKKLTFPFYTGFFPNTVFPMKQANSIQKYIEIPHSDEPTYAGEEHAEVADSGKPVQEGGVNAPAAEKMEKSPLLQKLSAVLSRPLLQFLEDEKATQQARLAARIPQNANLKQYPVATPTIPPPMGMAQAPAQPAPQPQQPAQPAQARPVGNGAGPTANPINSFGALSASGNINGNAAFGIKNSPDSLKTAGIASTGRSMADAAQGEGVDPTAAAVAGLLGAGALYGTYHGGKKLLSPILNRANLRTLPEEEIAKFSLPIKATNTQHAFAERYRAPGILGGFYMDTDEDALSNALHRMTKKRTGAQSRLDSGDYTPEDLDIAGKLLVNKYPNRYRLPAQMKTAQSDYLSKVTNMDFPVHPDPEDLDLDDEERMKTAGKATPCSCGCGDTTKTCKCSSSCSCRKAGGSCYVGEKAASTPAWQRSAGKNPEGGLNAKGRASYKAQTGGTLKAPVTESNPTGERDKRQNSFCSRMCGMKRVNTGADTAKDPDSRINKSLRKWNCKCGSALEFGQKMAAENEPVSQPTPTPTPKPKKKAKPAGGHNYMPQGVVAGLLLSKVLRAGYRAYQESEDAEPMQYSPDMYNQSDLPAMNNDSKYAAFEFGQKMASMAPIYGALAGAGLGALNNAVNHGDVQRVGNYLTGNDSDAMYPGTFPNHSLDYLGRNMAEGAVLGGGAGVGYDALKLMLGGKAKEQPKEQPKAEEEKASAYRALQDIPSGAGPNQIEDAVMRFNQLRALVRPDTETLKARSLSRGGFQHELRRIATNSQGKEKYNLSEMAPNPNLRAALAGAAGLAGTGALAYMNGAEGLGAGLAGTGLAAGGAYLHGLHQRKNFKNTSKLLKDYGLLKPELLRQAYPLLADNYRAG